MEEPKLQLKLLLPKLLFRCERVTDLFLLKAAAAVLRCCAAAAFLGGDEPL